MYKFFFLLFIMQMTLLSAQEILVNNDDGAPGYVESGSTWYNGWGSGYDGSSYRVTERPPTALNTATWTPNISVPGLYEVSTIFLAGANRTSQAPYTIYHANGSEVVDVNQQGNGMQEIVLGSFYFNAGTEGKVILSNQGENGTYIADTIRFVRQNGAYLSFSNLSFSPRHPEAGDTVTISVQVLPEDNIQEVQAHYSVQPGGASDTLLPQHVGNGKYEAEIPPQDSQSFVQFYFTAADTENNVYTSDSISYQVDSGEYRSIWAHAWGRSFRNQQEAQELVNTCRNNNINTIMIQVRKVGDAYYDSFEPRATNITGGADYDPLQYLIDLAHDTSGGQEYIHVHAWFVMQRIDTTGSNMRSNPAHILYQHPEYVMYDDEGNDLYNGNTYFLDPGHPGAVEWNIDVILDCMEKYDIDGVNLDYIRYPGARWGYNPTSIERFQSAFDRNDIPAFNDPDWSDWRRLQITNHIKKLYVKMWEKDPSVILTACTINWGWNYTEQTFQNSSAYSGVFQDWVGWLQEGILDYNALMNYVPGDDPDRYEGWTDLSLANDNIRGSIIGIGAYMHDSVQDSMDHLLYARHEEAAGLNIYNWYGEVRENTQEETRTDFYDALSTQVFDDWVDPPVSAWKTYPTKGIIHGTITYNGEELDYCAAELNNDPDTRVYSDGTGWYGILEVPAGKHILTFHKNGYPSRSIDITVINGGDIVTKDIDLARSRVRGWELFQ